LLFWGREWAAALAKAPFHIKMTYRHYYMLLAGSLAFGLVTGLYFGEVWAGAVAFFGMILLGGYACALLLPNSQCDS
jgi:hypothetical protein